MNDIELAAWTSLVEMTQKFLGNFKDENYKEIVQNCLNNFRIMDCNMSIKVHF